MARITKPIRPFIVGHRSKCFRKLTQFFIFNVRLTRITRCLYRCHAHQWGWRGVATPNVTFRITKIHPLCGTKSLYTTFDLKFERFNESITTYVTGTLCWQPTFIKPRSP